MPSPSHPSDPADPADLGERRTPNAERREEPCAWCREPATERSVWVTGRQVRHSVPICKFCGSAVATGDYQITITVMDSRRTLRGQDLPQHNGHAHW